MGTQSIFGTKARKYCHSCSNVLWIVGEGVCGGRRTICLMKLNQSIPLDVSLHMGAFISNSQAIGTFNSNVVVHRSLPWCGQFLSETHRTILGCQAASAVENCSGLPLNYGRNYEAALNVTSDGFVGGYEYSCENLHRTGNCCTNLGLPECATDTSKGGVSPSFFGG
jgi:hypothetical protein